MVVIVSFFGVLFTNNQRSIFNVRGYRKLEDQLEKLDYYRAIKDYSQPGMKVLFWGFGQNVYAPLDLQRASGFLYPQFAFGDSESAEIVRKRYLSDLTIQKPDLIVELIGENTFGLTDTARFSIKNGHPELYKMIINEYQYLICENNIVIWRKIYHG